MFVESRRRNFLNHNSGLKLGAVVHKGNSFWATSQRSACQMQSFYHTENKGQLLKYNLL